MDIGPPVFIVGAGRSGTTLLRHLLASHPAVFSPGHETQYFNHLDRIRRRFADLSEERWRREVAVFVRMTFRPGFRLSRVSSWHPTQEELESVRPLVDEVTYGDYGAAFAQVIHTVTQENGKQRWIEKSPGHVFARDHIKRTFPDARIIEVVRDPRDVLASRKTLREQVSRPGRYRPEQRSRRDLELSFDPFWDSIRWRGAIRAGQDGRRRWPDHWHRLRYEDLVQDPARTVRELCDFIDLRFEPRMLKVPRGRPADADMRSAETGVSSTSVGRWRRTLSDVEAAICQRLCRHEMQALGYRSDQLAVRRSRVYLTIAVRSTREVVVRASRRLRGGGVGELVSALRVYRRRYISSLLPGRARVTR